MKVQIVNNKIEIKFKYDFALVSFVKSLDGREYSPSSHSWSLPVTSSLETIEQLSLKGFQIDQEVWQVVREFHNKAREAEAIAGLDDTEFTSDLPLYDFQRVGAAFLYKVGSGILGDPPGLGKTLMSLAVAQKAQAKKILIFTPSAVKFQFAGEISRFLPGATVVVINGTKDERIEQWRSDVEFYIANYELLLRDLENIDVREWDLLIADEATKISNPGAKQSKAIKKLRARRRIAMTGTLISNRADDVWNICDFVSPGSMGNYWNFCGRYCLKNQFGGIYAYHNLDELRDKLKRYMIRRNREDVLPELPEKIETDIPFELSDQERALYNKIKKEILFEIDKTDIDKLENPMTIQHSIVKLLRLQQLTNSMELIGSNVKSTKIEVLKELIAERVEEDKVIVYTKFSQFADILERELAGYKPLKITGEVTERQGIIDSFNQSDENRVMIITDAAAFGINLQFKCSTIIFMDQPFSLARFEQVCGRVFRIGQKKSVSILSLLAIKTVDYHLKKILKTKKELSEKVLTMEDIRDILE